MRKKSSLVFVSYWYFILQVEILLDMLAQKTAEANMQASLYFFWTKKMFSTDKSFALLALLLFYKFLCRMRK
jgi:hypothetical protein